MSDPVEIALITAAGVTLSGSLSTIVLVMMKRLEVKVDGRLTDLIEANKRADQAQGHLEGVKAEQDRTTKGT
jgi:hypothetical protein